MNITIVFLLILGCSLLHSCASVLRSYKPNTMHIHSKPDSANIFVNGEYKGTTPTTLELPCHKRYIVEICKQGHHTVRDTVLASISTGWAITDFLMAIPLAGMPIIADNLIGDGYTLTTEQQYYTIPLLSDTTSLSTTPMARQQNSSSAPRTAVWAALGASFSSYLHYQWLPVHVVGISYTATPTITVRVNIEPSMLFSYQRVQSTIAALYTTPEDRVTNFPLNAPPTLQTRSIAMLTDATFALFGTAFYATGGGGLLYTDIRENHTPKIDNTVVHWLPVLSAGIGYRFANNNWFIEAQHRYSVTSVTAQNGSFSPAYTSCRIGVLLPVQW